MSDGMSDIMKSESIAKWANKMLMAQKEFIVSPTKEKLNELYSTCDIYGGSGSGYWGENPRALAERVREHYQSRFEGKKAMKTGMEEVAVLLNGIKHDFRLSELAELLTMSQGLKISGKDFYHKKNEVEDYLKEHITACHQEILENDVVSGAVLEDILRSTDVGKAYPKIKLGF